MHSKGGKNLTLGRKNEFCTFFSQKYGSFSTGFGTLFLEIVENLFSEYLLFKFSYLKLDKRILRYLFDNLIV